MSEFLPIKSSNLQAAKDNGDGSIDVTFANGTYRYEGVTPELWNDFQSTFDKDDSTGAFFHKNIRSLKSTKL